MLESGRQVGFLIASGHGEQANAIITPELGGDRRTDVGFVAEDGQVGVLA